jgi:hypothetical protein
MMNVKVVLAQLDKERSQLETQLRRIGDALSALKGVGSPNAGWGRRRKLPRSAIARIRAAQKLRWAKWRKAQRA